MAKTKKVAAAPKAAGKENALDRVISQIEKQYGQGAIMQMDETNYAKIEGISTGALSLDLALGGAGIPRGRVTELFGPESSGKTTLALHVIANAQRAGGVAAFI
jgi:recombination protein RecA